MFSLLDGLRVLLGKQETRSVSKRLREKPPRPQRQLHRAGKSHLGSGPPHLTYPSKTSPSEPKLRLISKANVGTFPFSVPGLFYISPRGISQLSQISTSPEPSSLPAKAPVLEREKRKDSHQKHYALHIAGLHVFCDCNSHE